MIHTLSKWSPLNRSRGAISFASLPACWSTHISLHLPPPSSISPLCDLNIHLQYRSFSFLHNSLHQRLPVFLLSPLSSSRSVYGYFQERGRQMRASLIWEWCCEMRKDAQNMKEIKMSDMPKNKDIKLLLSQCGCWMGCGWNRPRQVLVRNSSQTETGQKM